MMPSHLTQQNRTCVVFDLLLFEKIVCLRIDSINSHKNNDIAGETSALGSGEVFSISHCFSIDHSLYSCYIVSPCCVGNRSSVHNEYV